MSRPVLSSPAADSQTYVVPNANLRFVPSGAHRNRAPILHTENDCKIVEVDGYALLLEYADGTRGWTGWTGHAVIPLDDFCGHGHKTPDVAMRCRDLRRLERAR